MNTTAHADQLHAELRDARCCDALEPCEPCREKAAEVRKARREVPVIPAPRKPSALALRLAAVR